VRAEMEARAATEPLRDLSLKEGETLSIKVNVGGSGKPRAPRPRPAGGSGVLPPPPGAPGLLAPPPKAGMANAIAPAPPSSAAPTNGSPAVECDDFGDFASFEGAGSGAAEGDDDDSFGDWQ
jgi:hypothetical protein